MAVPPAGALSPQRLKTGGMESVRQHIGSNTRLDFTFKNRSGYIRCIKQTCAAFRQFLRAHDGACATLAGHLGQQLRDRAARRTQCPISRCIQSAFDPHPFDTLQSAWCHVLQEAKGGEREADGGAASLCCHCASGRTSTCAEAASPAALVGLRGNLFASSDDGCGLTRTPKAHIQQGPGSVV